MLSSLGSLTPTHTDTQTHTHTLTFTCTYTHPSRIFSSRNTGPTRNHRPNQQHITISQYHNITISRYHVITISRYHNITISQYHNAFLTRTYIAPPNPCTATELDAFLTVFCDVHGYVVVPFLGPHHHVVNATRHNV